LEKERSYRLAHFFSAFSGVGFSAMATFREIGKWKGAEIGVVSMCPGRP